MKIVVLLLIFCNNLFANDFISFFNQIDSFKANFTQNIDNQKTSGVLSFMRPKSLKWHTLKPDEKFLILHNNKITVYDVWLQTANIINYRKNDLVEYLTTRPSELKEIPKFISKKNNLNYYQLGEVFFGFKDKNLAEIVTTNEFNEQIYIKLSNLEKNIDLTDAFIIKFADDIDIIEE